MSAAVPNALLIDAVIPARDCAQTLRATLGALPVGQLRSVVVVDMASSDDTGQVARDLGAVVLREPRGGVGAACRRAVQHFEVLPRPPDVVVFAAQDERADVRQLSALLDPIVTDNAELVLGVTRGRRRQFQPGKRLALSLMGAIYRRQFADMGTFRAIRFAALVALGLSDRGTGFQVEMQVKALTLGLHIAEVEIPERPGDDSRRNSRGMGESMRSTSKALYRILRHSTAR